MKLSGEDLVKIIKSCKSANVSHLKIGDIDISFDGKARNKSKTLETSSDDLLLKADDTNKQLVLTELSNEAQSEREKNESDISFDEDLNLILNDPTEWERRAMENEV